MLGTRSINLSLLYLSSASDAPFVLAVAHSLIALEIRVKAPMIWPYRVAAYDIWKLNTHPNSDNRQNNDHFEQTEALLPINPGKA